MSKDMSFWLKHLLGTVGTTGSGPYVHTGTEGTTGALMGKSFTAQFNAPFHPAGTNQAVTFGGCKVPKWTLGCDTDGMLVLGLDLWAANWTTGTALATYAETASQVNFAWAHGAVTVAGTQLDLDSFTVEVDQGMNVDRRQIRGNTEAKEPSLGELAITASMTADFESLTQFNRVHATSVSSLSAAVVATFTNGSDIVTATIPGFRRFRASGSTSCRSPATGVRSSRNCLALRSGTAPTAPSRSPSPPRRRCLAKWPAPPASRPTKVLSGSTA